MDVAKISTGKAPPGDVNVVIEIPQGSSVKYEVDKESGAIVVDRFLFTPMAYPAAYGFIPNTTRRSSASRMTRSIRSSRTIPNSRRCRRSPAR
jgi:inorganic pyrophosphatase